IPVDCGSITPSSAQAATAASAAVPPALSTSIPASAAAGCEVAIMPFWAWTVERPAKWKFLMRNGSLDRCFEGAYPGKRVYMTYSRGPRQWVVYQGSNAGVAGF